MRPIRAAVVVVLAVTGCQKMDTIPSAGTGPRASGADRYNRVFTTRRRPRRAGRVEPPDELAAAFLKKVPLGTPVAEAQRIMEREGFSCLLFPEEKDKADKTDRMDKKKPGTLHCILLDDPRGPSVHIE